MHIIEGAGRTQTDARTIVVALPVLVHEFLFSFAPGLNQCVRVVFDQRSVIDIGWFEYGLLRRSEFGDPIGHAGLIMSARVVQVFRCIAIEERTPLFFALPGQCAVGSRLIENDQIATFERDGVDQLLIGLVEQDFPGAFVIGLVTAGNNS